MWEQRPATHLLILLEYNRGHADRFAVSDFQQVPAHRLEVAMHNLRRHSAPKSCVSGFVSARFKLEVGGGNKRDENDIPAAMPLPCLSARWEREQLSADRDGGQAVGDCAADADLEHPDGVLELSLEQRELFVGQEPVRQPAAQSRGDADEDEHDEAQDEHRGRLR